MDMIFTEQDVNKILAELTELPIKQLPIVQKIQSIFQEKYNEQLKLKEEAEAKKQEEEAKHKAYLAEQEASIIQELEIEPELPLTLGN